MCRYILAIDQSTSGTKAILFNEKCGVAGRKTVAHTQFYPHPGWVEHDAEEIYKNTLRAICGVLEDTDISPDRICALSLTNQRETVVLWNRTTGRPVYNAIVWQCARARDICEQLKKDNCANKVTEKTGLMLSPYFSAAKIKWILDNVEDAHAAAARGELMCGNMDSWLIYNLTCGKTHATDYSNASRTQIFNINSLRWDDELMALFTIPTNIMPEVRPSDALFGYTTCGGIFSSPIPITGVLGDSHAALFGQNCFEEGMAKATYGTGSSIMMNIGKNQMRSKKGLVTSIAWGLGNTVEYVLEGNVNSTGNTIKWIAENLELIADSKSASTIAASVEDNGGVYMVPAFTGLGAPYWDSKAKAVLTGMTLGTKRAHIVRAAEESIAFQIRDILDLMADEYGKPLKELRVDGGPTRDNFLMQFQADILSADVVRTKVEELSAAGSAYMAGLSRGIWANKQEISGLRQVDKKFSGKMDNMVRDNLYGGWKEAVSRALYPT